MKKHAVAIVCGAKDAKTKRRYNAIFGRGSQYGARSRTEAGLVEPSGDWPKYRVKIPARYKTRNERTVWSGGYRLGYAIGTWIWK